MNLTRVQVTQQRAAALALTLIMVLILTAMTGALIELGRADLGNAGHYISNVRAHSLAQSGLEHALLRLTYDSGFHDSVHVDSSTGSYEFHFNPSLPNFSVNNLLAGSPSSQLNSQSNVVAPYRVDLVVVGRSGSVSSRLHAVCTSGFSLTKSAGSDKSITITDTSEVGGIRSLTDPVPVGGGLFTHFVSVSSSEPSISVPSSTFTLSSLSTVSAPKPNGGLDIVGNVPTAQKRTQCSDKVPEIDVHELVALQSAVTTTPTGMTPFAAGYQVTSPSLTGVQYVDKELTVRGDLQLNRGSLYVKGDLTVYGGVIGEGSIFSDGNVKILGGTSSLRTNQSTGAAVYAQGDVDLEGINAVGYLQSLAVSHPTLHAELNNLLSLPSPIPGQIPQLLQDMKSSDLKSAWGAATAVGGYFAGENPAAVVGANLGVLGQPLQGPNGTRGQSGARNALLGTAREVKVALGSAYAGDARAQKIVRGLEELSYECRGSLFTMNDSLNPDYTPISGTSTYTNTTWDDNVYLPVGQRDTVPPISAIAVDASWNDPLMTWDLAKQQALGTIFPSLSIDHQYRALFMGSFQSPQLVTKFRQQLNAISQWNPSNLNWLGTSNFQGIVYAHGKLTVKNDFNLYGTALAHGKIEIGEHSKLIYVEEYGRTIGTSGPVQLLWKNEL